MPYEEGTEARRDVGLDIFIEIRWRGLKVGAVVSLGLERVEQLSWGDDVDRY